jgi:phosphonoacetaldehyde hydrolase
MIFRVMEILRIYPPSAVVKVGDTVPDIEEGLSAGAWSVGVLRTGSEVGCTEEEWEALSSADRGELLSRARNKLEAAGAHGTIETLADLPAYIEDFSRRLLCGEKP